jgi:hypothetical protein
MQIDVESIEILLIIMSFMIMVLRKKQLWKDTNLKRHLSNPLKAITNQSLSQKDKII